MQDSKDIDWTGEYRRSEADGEEAEVARDEVAEASNDDSAGDGWQHYRRWISKAPAPRARRSGIDPALYSWKGYRTWTEQVKRNWTDKD